MPWGRVDDTHYDHDKVLSIPLAVRNEAIGLYWRAISYANAKLTDGYVSAAVVAEVLNGRQELADALVKVRLWHRKRGGYVIHDFLNGFNKSRAEVESDRAKKAEAGRLGGLRSGETRRHEAGPKQRRTTNEARASGVLELPSRPVPTESESAAAAVGGPPLRARSREAEGREAAAAGRSGR